MNVALVGGGKIGCSIARLLDSAPFVATLRIGDIAPPAPCDIRHLTKTTCLTLDATDPAQLRAFLDRADALVSAAPYHLNRTIASACAQAGVPYFDLTEDVATTQFIRSLASDHPHLTFMPQCGLAPGAVNIIGGSLAREFDSVRTLELRVGALPLHAGNHMKYYLSWSTAGLINEYCELCDALCHGQHLRLLPLDGLEQLTLDGVEYEAFNTSGGVATMCETFAGQITELSYKTIRYPGHCRLMQFLLRDLNLAQHRALLAQIFDQEIPLTDEDVVIMLVHAVGSRADRVQQRHFVRKIRGATVHGRPLSAIQLTTAAGLAAVLELFALGRLAPGFVRQECVELTDFLATHWGGRVFGPDPNETQPPPP